VSALSFEEEKKVELKNKTKRNETTADFFVQAVRKKKLSCLSHDAAQKI
jgi:hypothetical protein